MHPISTTLTDAHFAFICWRYEQLTRRMDMDTAFRVAKSDLADALVMRRCPYHQARLSDIARN